MTDQEHVAALLAREQAAMEAAVGGYRAFHAPRFRYLLQTCRSLCPSSSIEVLDVGLSMLSLELLNFYDNVTTLGFPAQPYDVLDIETDDGRHKRIKRNIEYDLNDARHAAPVATEEAFDLIVFAEVIEHLHTALELTLFVLKRLMKPSGYMVLQTPNAAALHKRFNLLIGRNPYEKIRINPRNPGRFREYTKSELVCYARQLGLDVVSHKFRDYFGWQEDVFTLVLFKALVAVVPAFARGQTLVLRNPD